MSLDEATLEGVRAGMRGLQAVAHHERVYKDECVLSYATPFRWVTSPARFASVPEYACRTEAR